MGLPARDEARNWIGWTVVDREGTELGACTAVLADESTGAPEWMYVEVDGASAVVPAVDADGSGERVTVTVTRAQVTGAPRVGGGSRLTQQQESELYRHYGIAASRDASETLLPTSGAGTSGGTGRSAAAAAVALVAVAGLGVAGVRSRRPAGRQSSVQGLWSRRPWAPQPASRAEQVAGQVRVASARARDGARQLGRVAAPLAAAAAESARPQTGRAGEGARHLTRVAAPLAAAAAESARHRTVRAGEGARHLTRVAAPLAAAAAESARHRTVRAGEGARHLTRVAAPLAAAAAESARHRAALGAAQLRHAARLTSSATGTRVRG